MNDVKHFLLQVELYDAHIENKLEELRKLKELTRQITSSLKPDVVAHTGSPDKLGEAVAKIVDLENEIDAAVDDYIDKRREVSALIEKIDSADQVSILHKLYFERKPWNEIAMEMHMTERNAQYIHGRALQSVRRILRERVE